MSRKNIAVVRRSVNRTNTTKPISSNGTAEKEKEEKKYVEIREIEKGEKLYTKAEEDFEYWMPSAGATLKLIVSIRICSALWGIISDCDEVYNYWEPLHLFLYGHGFQTWEYSPIYAIRSYFYVYLHYIPASVFTAFLGVSKIAVFVVTRCTIGLFCLVGEYLMYLAVCKRLNIATGRHFMLFSIFSSGVFTASTAFLPSSFAMSLNFYLLAAYLNEQWWLAILCTALSALVGWPFAAVLGLPVVIDMLLIRQKRYAFFAWSAVFGIGISALLFLVDSHYFGKRVFAPLNIVLYNVLSGPGPELYGVEPVSYYIKNLVLNWNFALPLALISLPVTLYCYRIHVKVLEVHKPVFGIPRNLQYWDRYIPVFLIWFAAASWCAIFFTQPHKEERFLFPIYPHIALLAALAIEALQRIFTKIQKNENISTLLWFISIFFIIICVSRSYSNIRNYGGHLEIYKHLTDKVHNEKILTKNENIRLCIGKEWHHFPSSFFIPEADSFIGLDKRVELSFIESEFRGLLPKPFIKARSLVETTRFIPTEMNDQNKEEVSRYVNLESCDLVVDVDAPGTDRQIDFRTIPDKFRAVIHVPFLIPHESHPFFRAFFIPYLSDIYTKWTNYTVYMRVL
ncbi:unnamed protein product [Caenorhabditis angaria]|uniref:Mannosyltransferase n=1 Tax=Caenorhabditis angaria TaxID=860376 RepID=A0A9P1MWQ4_9PELO|nr:unnamed protein product [Caenorhabditis angaria]